MFTRIPQRVKCVGGDFRCSGSSKWPENISDSGPASWDFSSFNLPLRASVRKTQTKSWNWKPKRNDILFFARVCQLLVRLEPILPRVVREYLIISCLRCCLNMTVRLPGATQLLWDRYFPWEISTLTTTTGQRDQWGLTICLQHCRSESDWTISVGVSTMALVVVGGGTSLLSAERLIKVVVW